MTEEERLRTELKQIQQSIERSGHKIDSLRWKMEVLEDAIANEGDFRIRGQLVQELGQIKDQCASEIDLIPDLEARKIEAEAELQREIDFAAERLKRSTEEEPDGSSFEEEFLARRKLRRDRRNKIDGL
jgi:predicted  nucleic acid-binding Zn-ribbon protein